MSQPKDRRTLPREPLHLAALIEVDGREIGCGISRDASGSGLLLFTHVQVDEGANVSLKLFVPHEDDPRQVEAKVIRAERIRPDEGIVWDFRMAVALRNPPPELEELVRNLTKRPPAAPS
jgi:hypothetical protein